MMGVRPLLVVLWLLAGWPASAEPAAPLQQQPHVLYQTSIINALLQGAYDGSVTIGDLKHHGDFGLGTVNGLDGELIGLDGRFLQVRSDGSVHGLGNEVGVPFAAVTFFRPVARVDVAPAEGFAAFGVALDRHLASVNTVVAIRVHGTFPHVKTRSVPRQQPPYRPLVQVVAEQAVFEFSDVTGTLIGFRTPTYLQGVNVPGYHLHFLSDDGRRGGHVLDLTTSAVTVDLDYAESVQIDLPQDGTFRNLGLGRDMSEELRRVEQ